MQIHPQRRPVSPDILRGIKRKEVLLLQTLRALLSRTVNRAKKEPAEKELGDEEVGDRVQCSGWHYTFGWMRRSDLDDQLCGFCYEDPEGVIIVSPELHHKNGIYLDCCEDVETGELYLCVSKIPKIMKPK